MKTSAGISSIFVGGILHSVCSFYCKRRSNDNNNRGFFQGVETGILNKFVHFIMKADILMKLLHMLQTGD